MCIEFEVRRKKILEEINTHKKENIIVESVQFIIIILDIFYTSIVAQPNAKKNKIGKEKQRKNNNI